MYQQVHMLTLESNSLLYNHDVIKYDKQDDNAAAWLFSADMLAKAAEKPDEHLGLLVYLFVFEEFIDAFQSHSMAHKHCIQIGIHMKLFLDTWKLFLKKQGYSEIHHFISKEAFNICGTLTNGLLSIIVKYWDHLPDSTPLMIWKLQKAIIDILKLYTMSLLSNKAYFKKNNFKATAQGYQHMYLNDTGVDYNSATDPTIAPPLVDLSNDLPFEEDEPAETKLSACKELQNTIDDIEKIYNLTQEEDEELDACTIAAITINLQQLAIINDMLEQDEEHRKELQTEVQHALSAYLHAVFSII
ncbi:hypothetical protein ARMSODRAFT_1012810 [Armillaria solidipes]|uniref:Uncharacterized protein n=1 Tax=Armillaria solidipes TaxID=1076256 RepID=A0A2H3C236_9AGAR|nr:hypothetical protein ARMSODRAFT_1012810 [Armillaria solidipes]